MKIFRGYFEITAWIIGLAMMAIMDPGTNSHYSFCLFRFIGIEHCPGCGLGHSISYLFHGNFKESFNAHPLGLFAVAIILHRVFKLSSIHFLSKFKKYNYGQ